jgi:ABC-type nitrate/sulfonate/bicarbonate transport system substrate-binding protein
LTSTGALYEICLIKATLAILLVLVSASNAHAKDLNYGWPGRGSWSTLPFVVGAEKGLFEKEALKVSGNVSLQGQG